MRWQSQKFSELASLRKGISYKSEDYAHDDSGAVFLTIKCVSKSGGFNSTGVKYYAGDYHTGDLLQANDLLIANTDLTRAGDIVGCPLLVPDFGDKSVLMSMDLSKVCVNQSKADPRFLYYLLMTHDVRKFMKDHASGSTVLHLQTSAVPNLSIRIPTQLAEQARIAEIIDAADRTIDSTITLIAKQQRTKTGLMQDLLTKGIDENGDLRSEDTHEFKESPLGPIPMEWNVSQISHLAERITSGSRGWAKYYSDEGALFLRIGNLTREHINFRFDDIVFVRPPVGEEGSRTRVKAGDILISITADLGIIGVIPKNFGEAYINQHIASIRLASKDLTSRWAGHFMQGHAFQTQVDAANESGAKAGLNLPTVSRLFLAFPESPQEQQAITEKLDHIDHSISCSKRQLAKLQRLKTGLMRDLLSGKVSVATPHEQEKQAVGATA